MGIFVCAIALVLVAGQSVQAQQRGKGAKKAAAPIRHGGELTERVRLLEKQIVDMRVVIDTLQSLSNRQAHAGPLRSGAPSFGGSGQGNARIDVLETQIKALTAQVEQLANQVRSLGSVHNDTQSSGSIPGSNWQTRAPGEDRKSSNSWSTRGSQSSTGQAVARSRTGDDNASANRNYLHAINLYNQDNFKAAGNALEAFVKSYPKHSQIPTARYRLAQVYYKLGKYTQAASQFWTLVRGYPNEPVAPDSFAMFAASLGRSGRIKDACEAFQRHRVKYPNDAPHMPPEAKAEQTRLRC